MKKSILLAALAVAAFGANAQYTVADPSLQPIADQSSNQIFDYIVLNEECVNKLVAAGKTVNNWSPNEDTRNLYIWSVGDTFVAGDSSYPGVGWNAESPNFDGYTALEVANVGWSGAGFNIGAAAPVSTEHFCADTHLHIAYRSPGVAPASIGFIVLNGDKIEKTGCIAVGDPFNDNGNIFPAVGPKANEEWQAIDITLGDIKKLYPAFDIEANKKAAWTGNPLAFLAGGVQGNSLALDAVYFYSPSAQGAVEGIAADAELVFTGRTINAAGAESIVVYDMAGNAVKAVNGSVAGVEDLPAGLYVAKAGNDVAKIVVR